jgi:hypothetical protein
MNEKKEFDKLRAKLEDEVKNTRSKLKELESFCDHKKKSGRLDLVPVEGRQDLFECQRCKAQFGITIYTKEQIIAAVDVIFDVGNQLKALSPDDGDRENDKYVQRIGAILADVAEFPVLYTKLVLKKGKKGQGGNNNNNRPGYRGKFGVQNTNIY